MMFPILRNWFSIFDRTFRGIHFFGESSSILFFEFLRNRLKLKELLYRQIESDIKHERLFLDGSDSEANVLIKLGALQQQIEYGDTPGDISLNSNLTPIELTEKVIEQHR